MNGIMSLLGVPGVVVIAVILFLVLTSLRVFAEWDRAVILRFGKFNRLAGPGVALLVPFADHSIKVDTRIITMDVPRQEMMTRDNVPVTVDAIVLFQVMDSRLAILKIENFARTTSLIAQTTLRSTIGQAELDELLSQRDQLNEKLKVVIDQQTEPYGVKVAAIEIRDVALPEWMRRAMAAQASHPLRRDGEADRRRIGGIQRI